MNRAFGAQAVVGMVTPYSSVLIDSNNKTNTNPRIETSREMVVKVLDGLYATLVVNTIHRKIVG